MNIPFLRELIYKVRRRRKQEFVNLRLGGLPIKYLENEVDLLEQLVDLQKDSLEELREENKALKEDIEKFKHYIDNVEGE